MSLRTDVLRQFKRKPGLFYWRVKEEGNEF